MPDGLHDLSEREKSALRLLVAGHDAKSTAAALGLSVHTINERLRDARRKLGVSSSREAARRLAAAEAGTHNSHVDQKLGVAAASGDAPVGGSPVAPLRGYRLVWLSGGMLIMSLLFAVVALSSFAPGHGAPAPSLSSVAQTAAAPSAPAEVRPALDWLTLIDARRWADSWKAAGSIFRSQLTTADWARLAQSARQPLGMVNGRVFAGIEKTSALPNAPAGDYTIVSFTTHFASKPDAIETVVLMREAGDWKVAGYFIR